MLFHASIPFNVYFMLSTVTTLVVGLLIGGVGREGGMAGNAVGR